MLFGCDRYLLSSCIAESSSSPSLSELKFIRMASSAEKGFSCICTSSPSFEFGVCIAVEEEGVPCAVEVEAEADDLVGRWLDFSILRIILAI